MLQTEEIAFPTVRTLMTDKFVKLVFWEFVKILPTTVRFPPIVALQETNRLLAVLIFPNTIILLLKFAVCETNNLLATEIFPAT